MKLLEAIAYGAGNKAKALNDQGIEVIVQERYGSATNSWYHIWHLARPRTVEDDITNLKGLAKFAVDAEENYWQPVK